ncbi:membrane protein [Oleiagrimonas citrea]|jgi:pilus assembly protein Flp/PilA|uniref:Pilus assembly protein n=1 Tax=Oleiagrimonas citrea TaxID=1665687 RepID=A0A846ZLB4_9GAMM|nr:pilus assembly protein [Oleiagrimonas citrea]NKZ38612.1 pilus assembly protein [Oleiagrimonas citrea]
MKLHSERRNGIRVRQRGQGMTEYIIITALIAIAAIGAVTYFGHTAREQVGAMAQELSGNSGKTQMDNAGQQASNAATEGDNAKNLANYHSDVNSGDGGG